MKNNKFLLSTLCILSLCGCATTLPAKNGKPVVTEKTTTETAQIETQQYFDDYSMECNIKSSNYYINIPENSEIVISEDDDISIFKLKDINNNDITAFVSIPSFNKNNSETDLLIEMKNFLAVGDQFIKPSENTEIKHEISLKNMETVNINKHDGFYNYGKIEIGEETTSYVIYTLEMNNDETGNKDICEFMLQAKNLNETDLKKIAKELIEQIEGGSNVIDG